MNAIVRITGGYDEPDWQRMTPCDGWTATDLAGHVLTAIDNWHVLLDDSEARASRPRFAWAEMDQFFKDRLAALPPGTGPQRIARFVDRAEQYFDRVEALDRELPLVSAFRDVTTVPMTIGCSPGSAGSSGMSTHGTSHEQPASRTGPTTQPPCTRQRRPPSAGPSVMRIRGKPSSTRCGQEAINVERTRPPGANPTAAWGRNPARGPDRGSDVVSDVTAPPITATVEVHRAGIAAIANVTEQYTADDWLRPTPCDEWTALDLAGHTITAAMMWHEALDDGVAGATTSRWRWAELPRANAEYLDALPAASGQDRIEDFVTLATSWCNRVADTDPELPIPVAVQDICPTPLTVATFTWLAGAEFHLHAWDFAQTIGDEYRARTDHAGSIRNARVALWGSASDEGDPWDLIIRESRS